MRRLMLAVLTGIMISAVTYSVAGAQTPQGRRTPAADTVKTGSYDLEITTDNGTMVGELVVSRDKGVLSATIKAGAMTPAVKSFARKSDDYVLTAGHGSVVITYTFTFHRDSISGSMLGSGGLAGTVTGVYRR